MRLPPVTIRTRLTLLYGLLFTISSAVMISTSYLFVRDRRPSGPEINRGRQAAREAAIEAGFPPGEGTLQGAAASNLESAARELAVEAREGVLSDLLSRSVTAFLITATASLVLAWWVAGRALAPVDAITATANQLSDTNLKERLAVSGPTDELSRLSHAFNRMLGRLESGFEARRRFAADASHELRTPLAVIRARADNVISGAEMASASQLALDIRREVDRADRLVDGLLALARIDDNAVADEPVELVDLVGEVISAQAAVADHAGLELDLRFDVDEAWAAGDERLLSLMVTNLVRNAIVHNTDGGWLTVAIGATPEHVEICIENSGPVILSGDVNALFERFNSNSRLGHGLGLAIVQAVATAHNARVDASPRDGGGMIVQVRIPRVEAATTGRR